jgi:hypothetical protein
MIPLGVTGTSVPGGIISRGKINRLGIRAPSESHTGRMLKSSLAPPGH